MIEAELKSYEVRIKAFSDIVLLQEWRRTAIGYKAHVRQYGYGHPSLGVWVVRLSAVEADLVERKLQKLLYGATAALEADIEANPKPWEFYKLGRDFWQEFRRPPSCYQVGPHTHRMIRELYPEMFPMVMTPVGMTDGELKMKYPPGTIIASDGIPIVQNFYLEEGKAVAALIWDGTGT
jgi:hypothetical protein